MIEAPTFISPGAVHTHTHMFLCVFVYLHAVVDPDCTRQSLEHFVFETRQVCCVALTGLELLM